jgi:hypothetical protein
MLRNRGKSLRERWAIAAQATAANYLENAAQELRNHCTITAQPVRKSLRNHFAPLRDHCAFTAQPLRNRFETSAQTLHNRNKITAKAQRNTCAIAIHCAITSLSLSNLCATPPQPLRTLRNYLATAALSVRDHSAISFATVALPLRNKWTIDAQSLCNRSATSA